MPPRNASSNSVASGCWDENGNIVNNNINNNNDPNHSMNGAGGGIDNGYLPSKKLLTTDDDSSVVSALKELLSSINQPQSLPHNLHNLNSNTIGGIAGLVSLLDTHLDNGIHIDSINTRRSLYGCNSLPSSPRKSFWTLFVDSFDDGTVQILIVSALVSLIVGMYEDPKMGYVEGVAILLAVLIVALVTAVNDYEKERQFRALSDANDDVDVLVMRSGKACRIPVADIVLGDVVCLEGGDQIPCDGVLLTCDGLEVDESALTGEPIDVEKHLNSDPFMLSGCTVTAGCGQYVAIAVGKDSQWGIIKSHLEKEQEQTPLQEKLDHMAAMIGYVGMGAAVATFVAMMFIKIYIQPSYLDEITVFNHALDAFIMGVTIVVVAVPEGLPLAVTISLAFSTKKMLADQNLIRHLAACETMGNATNICTDKTGTLTENRMTVVKGIFANRRNDDVIHNQQRCALQDISSHSLELILNGIANCSTARIIPQEEFHIEDPLHDNRPHIIGNKTEAALLLLAKSSWGNYDEPDVRRSASRFGKPGGSRLFPFSSARKRMSVLVHSSKEQREHYVEQYQQPTTNTSATSTTSSSSSWTQYHKGAAETVLADCTSYLDADGSEKPMTNTKRNEFNRIIQSYAKDALRCVALSHRHNIDAILDPTRATSEDCAQHLEHNMCLDAIVGIMDPLREGVINAVHTCQKAGIVVRMVTGDNLDTANAIARQANILTPGGLSMVGEEFRKLTPSQLDQILPKLQVLARSSPEDKHILVQRLNGGLMPENESQWLELHPNKHYASQRDLLLPGYKAEWCQSRIHGVGEVVGVTGDGTNDGPALKAADVGLSMGISGTDVAKNASDIIIMDDNFASIVKAVLWGRSVFDNIRKFLQFQLTVNVVALTITFLSAVGGYKPPLNAVMMLWVNLIMDTMGALALGTEPPTHELLNRRPYRRDASLINRPMWRNILVQASYQLGLLIFLLHRGPHVFNCQVGSTHHFTILFNAFVFCQVFNEFNAREIGDLFHPLRRLHKSPMFLLVIVFTVLTQYGIVEYGGAFTQTTSLSWEEWRITALLGGMSIPVGYIMRLIPVEEDPESFAGSNSAVVGVGDGEDDTKVSTLVGGRRGYLPFLIVVLAMGAYQMLHQGAA